MRRPPQSRTLLAGLAALATATLVSDASAQRFPTTLEDALMTALMFYEQEPEAGNPFSRPLVTSITRRPGYRRDVFPVPTDGSTAYNLSVELEVTGCTATLREVRRAGNGEMVNSVMSVDVRALVGVVQMEGAVLVQRVGRIATSTAQYGDSRPFTIPVDSLPARAAPGQPGYYPLSVIRWIGQQYCPATGAAVPPPTTPQPGSPRAAPAPSTPTGKPPAL